MTLPAVRAWLLDLLSDPVTGMGIDVYPNPIKNVPETDMVVFQTFPVEEKPLSFGNVGALYENRYQPDLLITLHDVGVDAGQDTLDQYVEKVKGILRAVHGPIPLVDAVTAKQSEIVLLEMLVAVRPARIQDISGTEGEEGDTYFGQFVCPTIIEQFRAS